MQKLSLTKRPGVICSSIVNRTQNHGKEEKVPAVSIPISQIFLTAEELGVLMQDPESQEALFTASRSKHLEPRWLGIGAIQIADKFKEAKVTIKCDNSNEPLILKPATIGSIILEPQIGGLTAMRCMISGVPDEHLQTLTMLNRKCTISILNGALADRNDNQRELPLGEGGPVAAGDDETTLAEAEKEEEEATQSAMGRQIMGADGRRRRAAKKK